MIKYDEKYSPHFMERLAASYDPYLRQIVKSNKFKGKNKIKNY